MSEDQRRRHHEARGKKLESLHDLSRKQPSEADVAQLQEHLDGESDRGLALVAAAMVENSLFWAIYRRMPDTGEESRKATFEEQTAPLNSFSNKIVFGRALGVYGPQTEKILNQIRSIRNAFAHSMRPLDFENPSVKAASYRLKVEGLLPPFPHLDNSRTRYRLACTFLIFQLLTDAHSQLKKTYLIGLP